MKKKLHFIYFFILILGATSYSQENRTESKLLTVKYSESFNCEEICKNSTTKLDGIVMEFDVIDKKQQKIYGKKIYAIGLCSLNCDNKDSNPEWVLEVSETQPAWTKKGEEITILNRSLLKKNTKRKKYWITDIRRASYTQ